VKFEEFGLNDDLLQGLESMGFVEATPIQEEALPAVLDGRDLIACAQTGTGKTAAFLLPVIHQIMKAGNREGSVKALVIVPTRELALQIDQALEGLSYFTQIGSIALYGGGDGSNFDQQKRILSEGTDFVIATPGKLISHLNLGYVSLSGLTHLILDEADRMLDMGFYEDLMRIVSYLPKERQTLMFSATMPPKMRKLAKDLMKNPHEISLAVGKPAEGVMQVAYLVHDSQKIELISRLLSKEGLDGVIVFSRTKKNVKEITRKLAKAQPSIEAMHSDLTQDEREEVMRKFRAKKIKILIATDILSRGIDIQGLQLVLNYDVPDEAADYVHRVGRTARADNTGMAITFITPDDQYKFGRIEKLIEREIIKQPVPPDIGESFEYNPNHRGKSSGFKGNRKKKPFRKKNR
jgi:superfamily II DNA/RNA helicase